MSPQSQAEPCPGRNQIEGAEQTSTTARVEAWRCTRCGMAWAISTVNRLPETSNGQRPAYFEQLAATVEEIGRLRWLLGQVIILGADSPGLTDEQLRARVLALAGAWAR